MAPKRIELYDVETGGSLGEIPEEQLRIMRDVFEEESEEDRDYWIDADSLELLAQRGADRQVLDRLASALGQREGLELGWREIP
jgi:hypothetical protein